MQRSAWVILNFKSSYQHFFTCPCFIFSSSFRIKRLVQANFIYKALRIREVLILCLPSATSWLEVSLHCIHYRALLIFPAPATDRGGALLFKWTEWCHGKAPIGQVWVSVFILWPVDAGLWWASPGCVCRSRETQNLWRKKISCYPKRKSRHYLQKGS